MPGADEVLARGRVHGGFATNRAVDLREQRSRHLDARNSPVINRRGKSREIAHHPASKRHHERRAVEASLDHAAADRFRFAHRFGFLAGRNFDHRRPKPCVRQTSAHLLRKERRDIIICDQRATGTFELPSYQRAGLLEKSRPDDDVITLRACPHD